MTPEETLLLARYVKACCPQQAMDAYTPEAWHDLLGDLSLADCRHAVAEVAKMQPFVAPSEIRAAVRRIHGERLARHPIPTPPAELVDDGPAYAAYIARETRRITSGEADRKAIRGPQ